MGGTRSKTPPKGRSQSERSADATARLIDATIACVHETGFAGTTTVVIARRAGLTRGALQHHFESRADLFAAVWHRIHERFLRIFEALPGPGTPIRQRADALLGRLWSEYSSSAYLAGLEIRLGTRGDAALHARLLTGVRHFNASYAEAWHNFFADAADARQIEACRRVVGSALRGLALQAVIEHDGVYYAETVEMCRSAMLRLLCAKAASQA